MKLAGFLSRSRHGTRILDNIGSIVPCPFIDRNPATSPRKPIHGPRECAQLNFRVGRDTARAAASVAQLHELVAPEDSRTPQLLVQAERRISSAKISTCDTSRGGTMAVTM
jgi:hypothetical protein